MTVERIYSMVPVTDETIVDFGIGTMEQQVAAAARIEERQRASRAAWLALPWWERVRRRIVNSRWRYEAPRRVSTAVDVLRGRHECD